MVIKEGINSKQWQAVVTLVALFRDPMRKLEKEGCMDALRKDIFTYIYIYIWCVKIMSEGQRLSLKERYVFVLKETTQSAPQ